MLTTLHYDVLRAVRRAEMPIQAQTIAELVHLHLCLCERLLCHLCSGEITGGDPWLERLKSGYVIAGVKRDGEASTGGWRALEEAHGNPWFFELNPAVWVDEALSGIRRDGHETKIENAVIPCYMRRH